MKQVGQRRRDVAGLVALVASALGVIPLTPRAPRLADPSVAALVAFEATVVILLGARASRKDLRGFERACVAAFLAGMPVVYLVDLALARVDDWRLVVVELAGLALFGALAWLGLRASPWFLVVGILIHGLLWDLSHLALRESAAFVPAWYALGCAIADVGVSGYAASRASDWNRLRRAER